MTEKTLKTPYYVWKVGDKELKLKLTTKNIFDLEKEYGCNLLMLINNMPALSVMLNIIAKSAEKFNHGVKKDDVYELYDEYVDEGHSQAELFAVVIMGIFGASGFFSSKMKEEMNSKLAEANGMI